MNYVLISVISYLIGSIPTAFIILKYTRGMDIRTQGSGNVGGLNAYEVSNSKSIGLFVALFDFLKGFTAVYISKIFDPSDFYLISLAVIFSVLGHCYSIWINFKGGRGLATALGGTVLFVPYTGIIWCILWLISFLKSKNVHIGNIFASVLTPFIVLFFSKTLVEFTYPQPKDTLWIFILTLIVNIIILLRHIEPIKSILRKSRKNEGAAKI